MSQRINLSRVHAVFRPLLLAGTALALASGAVAQNVELPVRRVVLSSSGLAHFEHQGRVSGNTTVDLPVRLEQVDDLLKSLVVFDSQGQLGGVSLPGREPLSQAFRDLPFPPDALSSPVTLLNALRGTRVTVSGPTQASGQVVSVTSEDVQLPGDQGTVTRHRLTLLGEQGLRQVLLENLDLLTFDDPVLNGQVRQALQAVNDHRVRDRRTLNISLRGQGEREVALAYVVPAPLWKSAYRLVLPRKAEEQGFLQGWGIIENMTGADWADVTLTLLSGNPVTFQQSLYTSYYVDRPEMPVQVFGRVLPRTDTGTIGAPAEAEPEIAPGGPSGGAAMQKSAPRPRAALRGMAMEADAVASAAPQALAEGFVGNAAPAAPPPPPPSQMAQAARAAQSEEATTQVSFTFPGTFSVKAGNSLMVPYLSGKLPMQRLALYQPDTHATHPLAAVRLKNSGDSGLPPGILTLYEPSSAGGTTFVGDAAMPALPKGEDRLISYALDTKTKIDRESRSQRVIAGAAVANGALRLKVKRSQSTVYTIKAPAEEDRVVLLEHPRQTDWTMAQPDPKDVETTNTHYRVAVPIEAGKTERVTVTLERPDLEVIRIENLSQQNLRFQAAAVGEVAPQVRQAFEALAQQRAALETVEAGLRALTQRRDEIFRDQSRIRDNIRSVPNGSDIHKTYLNQLRNQEEMLGELGRDIDTKQRELEEGRRRLAEAISKIRIE